jgi:hypothetical protein
MKTIRTNCFETNSSSSHSITIDTTSRRETASSPALSENGILYPARIEDDAVRDVFFTKPTQWSDSREWVFRAWTKDTKTALLIHYVYGLLDSENDLDPVMLERVLQTVAAYTGYDAIDLGDNFYARYSIDRYDEGNVDEAVEKVFETIGFSAFGKKILVDLEQLGLRVQEIAWDETKTLIDTSEEY